MARMRTRTIWLALLGTVMLAIAGFATWIALLPAQPESTTPRPIAADEIRATLAALAPNRRRRPLIAIIGINDVTETTDYIMPYGILRRADVADVVALATRPGNVTLYPALSVMPDATVAEFDENHPEGADYVIVPAMSREDDPAVLTWLARQSSKGAVVIGVCVGAKIVAAAGLLDGRRATTHWYSRNALLRENPTIHYVPNRRFVIDRGVMTTTGITASIPATLTLIEAIAGREKAMAVARNLGVDDWDARHDGSEFLLTRRFATTALRNRLFFWRTEKRIIPLHPGIDEVSLALTADAWSRTYRSKAVTWSASGAPIRTANGMRVVPDEIARDAPLRQRTMSLAGKPATAELYDALRNIEARYGASTAKMVAMQLEYPARHLRGLKRPAAAASAP